VTLRARLVVALLALALIPTAIFTAFTLDQLDRATRRWFQPGVEAALESSREVSKGALARLDALALAGADEWAVRWPAGSPTAARHRADICCSLRILQLIPYLLGRPTWVCIKTVLCTECVQAKCHCRAR